MKAKPLTFAEHNRILLDEVAKQRERIGELEAALESIADDTKPWHTCEHADRARDALGAEK